MRAAVCTAYGGPEVVRVRERPDPVAKPGEVLIRVHATTVSSGDARVRGASFPPGFSLPARLMFGVLQPRQPILGTEMSGVVEEIGAGVATFQPGDRVFGFSGAGMGCHAELKVLPADGPIAPIPPDFSFEEAAAISFGGTTALYFLRDLGKVQRGEHVLIVGASGAVGTAAVQLAKHLGATVTGVCSVGKAGLVRSLGADDVIDYAAEDFCRRGAQWDIILDTVGGMSLKRCRQALRPGGRLLLAVAGLGQMLTAPLQSSRTGIQVTAGAAPDRPEDIAELQGLCAAGAFRPVIDSRFPFEEIGKAHARVDTGRKAGSVIVTMR